jgi:hypothetical protein
MAQEIKLTVEEHDTPERRVRRRKIARAEAQRAANTRSRLACETRWNTRMSGMVLGTIMASIITTQPRIEKMTAGSALGTDPARGSDNTAPSTFRDAETAIMKRTALLRAT